MEKYPRNFKKMVMDNFIKIITFMLAIFLTVIYMELVVYFFQIQIFLKVNFKTTKQMEKVFTFITMAPNI